MPDIIFWRLFWSHAGTGILCILSYYHDLQPKFLTQSSLNLVKDLIYTIRYVHCQGLTSIAIALMAFPVLNFWILRWFIHQLKDIQTYIADRSTVIYCHSLGTVNHEDTKCHLSLLVQPILLCTLSTSVCAQAKLIIMIPCNLYGTKQVCRPF